MKSNTSPCSCRTWLWILLPVVVILCALFFRSFVPGKMLFANDGPLGVSVARMYQMPEGFFGVWNDLFWLGMDSGSFPWNSWGIMRWLFGPHGYVNFSPLASLLFCGFCAAVFFRALGFKPIVCSLGALAAGLNGNFFSNACWGLPSRATGLGMTFLALAALHGSVRGPTALRLLKIVFAGFAVGMSISEASDNGVIFSLFVGTFALVFLYLQARQESGAPALKAAVKTGALVGLVVLCAVLPVIQTFIMTYNTSYKDAIGRTAAMSEGQRWAFATQWSLPPVETLRVVVPGLFGYKLDTPNGGNYWGGVGRDLAYDQTHQGFARHSGAGEYAGILVILIAVWAFANSWRKQDSAFAPTEKRLIWFWSGAALLALLFSWGHHAPFYNFVYHLPYFSNLRNPMKFMHAFHLCALILFGYGLQGIWRKYLEPATVKAQSFEKKWLLGSWAAVAVALVGMAAFTMASGSVIRYLSSEGFEETLPRLMASHATGELFWATFFLAVSVIAIWMIQKGVFAGAKATRAAVFLGLILMVDFARANTPWIHYYNWKEKYASNPILDVLRTDPQLHRVAFPPFKLNQQFDYLNYVYGVEWLQHQFQYYNIQAVDVSQDPRTAGDKFTYQEALRNNAVRYWQLTNTRFLFGLVGLAESLNAQLDPGQNRFRMHTPFTLARKPDTVFDAQKNDSGPFALMEFTGALPRAKLYSQWESITDEQAALRRIADPAFDPFQSVVVSGATATPAPAANTNAPGTVDFVSYAPKEVKLKASANGQAILLLNDRFHPDWKVWVDDKPEKLLRCNYLVRGVLLAPGNHTVVFRFQPPSMFWLTFVVVNGGLLLGITIVFWSRRHAEGASPAPMSAEHKAAEPKSQIANRKS